MPAGAAGAAERSECRGGLLEHVVREIDAGDGETCGGEPDRVTADTAAQIKEAGTRLEVELAENEVDLSIGVLGEYVFQIPWCLFGKEALPWVHRSLYATRGLRCYDGP